MQKSSDPISSLMRVRQKLGFMALGRGTQSTSVSWQIGLRMKSKNAYVGKAFGLFDKHILILQQVVDPELQAWILPDFSTTTHNDTVICSVLMMATLNA